MSYARLESKIKFINEFMSSTLMIMKKQEEDMENMDTY